MQTNEDFVLILLELCDGTVRGKSLLQQRLFFLSNALNIDLDYQRHFYGAYSAEVVTAISKLNSLGFIVQSQCEPCTDTGAYEMLPILCQITDDGRTVLGALRKKYVTLFELASRAMIEFNRMDCFHDSVALSVAAKLALTPNGYTNATNACDIAENFRASGWPVPDLAVEKALGFLRNLKATSEEPAIA